MDELQQQLTDLQETVELLTLDKEQLTLDKELLEEQLQQAQEEIVALKTTAPRSTTQVDDAELHRIHDENSKLREALRRLNDLHEQDKTTLEEQKLEIEITLSELEELRAYKEQASVEIDELKQTVDSMSSFESMIENLTNSNLDLSSSLSEAKQTIQELEDAIEVNEELDQQQRDQIEADRKTIDSLQVSVHNFELILQEKDASLHDVQKKLDAMRQRYYGEKQEVEKLQQSLSLGNQDHKETEAIIRENALLKHQTDELQLESWNLRNQLANSNIQRLRFQALYTRLNDFFGSTSYFMEENKLLNMEILCVSTISAGFEAGKQLSLLLNNFHHSAISTTPTKKLYLLQAESIAKTASLLATAYHVLLPLQASVIKTTLPRIRDQSRKVLNDISLHQESMQMMQHLQTIKSVFDAIVQQAPKFMQPIRKVLNFDAALSTVVSQEPEETTANITLSSITEQLERHSEYISLKSEVVPALATLVETLKTTLVTFTSASSAAANTNDSTSEDSLSSVSSVLEQGLLSILPFPQGDGSHAKSHAASMTDISIEETAASAHSDWSTHESYYLEREVCVETLFITLHSLLEWILYQGETSTWSKAMSHQVIDTLRSMKIELDDCVRLSYKTFTRYLAQMKYYRPVLHAIIELIRLFRASESSQLVLLPFSTEEVHPSLKQVLVALRGLRSDITTHVGTSSNETHKTASTPLRYFPYIFLYTTSTSSAASSNTAGNASSVSVASNQQDASLSTALEQVGYVIERYWSLLLQGENELLVSGQTLAQHKGMSHLDVMSWKERVHSFRTKILSSFDIASSAKSSYEEGADTNTSAASAAGNHSPFRGSKDHNSTAAGAVGDNKLWQRKLELKDAELKMALKQVSALQEAQDQLSSQLTELQSSSRTSKSAESANADSSSTIHRLQEEIKALEEAVDSLDKRYEDVARENKLLKANAGSSNSGVGAHAPTPPSSTSAVSSGGRPPLASATTTAAGAGNSHPPKMPRAKVSLDLFEATKALVSGATTTANTASSLAVNPLAATTGSSSSATSSRAPSPHVSTRATNASVGAGGGGGGFTSKATASDQTNAILGACTPFEQYLLEQVKQWKRIALRRLTQSLRPLPTTSVRNSAHCDGDQESSMLVLTGTTVDIAIPKTQSEHHASGDCFAAYRALRLARVQHAKIISREAEQPTHHIRKSVLDSNLKQQSSKTLAHILYRLHASSQQ